MTTSHTLTGELHLHKAFDMFQIQVTETKRMYNEEHILKLHYSSSHQIACFKVTEGLHPTPLSARLLSQLYNVASFATVQVMSCLHSPELRCSCRNVVRFCCDLKACNLLRTSIDNYRSFRVNGEHS
jgi:hypothetical protein